MGFEQSLIKNMSISKKEQNGRTASMLFRQGGIFLYPIDNSSTIEQKTI